MRAGSQSGQRQVHLQAWPHLAQKLMLTRVPMQNARRSCIPQRCSSPSVEPTRYRLANQQRQPTVCASAPQRVVILARVQPQQPAEHAQHARSAKLRSTRFHLAPTPTTRSANRSVHVYEHGFQCMPVLHMCDACVIAGNSTKWLDTPVTFGQGH